MVRYIRFHEYAENRKYETVTHNRKIGHKISGKVYLTPIMLNRGN